jgi:ElaB/YqjD/DUF883 family membrane-anchored ribosome-binding protein
MFDTKSAAPVQQLADQAAPLLSRASEQAGALVHRSAEALRDTTHQLRQSALRASDNTVDYIREAPVKSMLIAAAAGAALTALIALSIRSSSDRR